MRNYLVPGEAARAIEFPITFFYLSGLQAASKIVAVLEFGIRRGAIARSMSGRW